MIYSNSLTFSYTKRYNCAKKKLNIRIVAKNFLKNSYINRIHQNRKKKNFLNENFFMNENFEEFFRSSST